MKNVVKKPLVLGALCGLISFGLDFWAIPKGFGGWTDLIWMTLMVFFPAVIAVLLFKKADYEKPGYIFVGLPIQYGMLIGFARPVSEIWGSSIEHSLGWLSYIGSAFPWPFVVTLIQFLIIFGIRKLKE